MNENIQNKYLELLKDSRKINRDNPIRRSRKERNKLLIELGALFEMLGLEELDPYLILGFLIDKRKELLEAENNETNKKMYKSISYIFLTERRKRKKEELMKLKGEKENG